MSVERELLKEACDLLDDYWKGGKTSHRNRKLFYEIKELLAQPEHEPVAWMYERQKGDFTERTLSVGFEKNFDGTTIPLYTSPPKREPLSEHEILALSEKLGRLAFARAIEKAHGIGVDDE